jgi:hypothetical protein
MIELALLAGLGAVGYMLASQQPQKDNPFQEKFTSMSDSGGYGVNIHKDSVTHTQDAKGHNNEVPFFGSRITQSMYSGANDGILDSHTGAGKEYFQKREVKSFYDAKPATGNPFGNSNESDFYQSRMVSGQQMRNVFPIDQVRVGPGTNDGYTNLGKGGFQQDQAREYMLPKTTDELRIETKPKLSYEPPVIPGANQVTKPGIQADVKKNKPDRFAVLGMDRANTAVGAQTAPHIYPEQPMKLQARESTSVAYNGQAGGNSIFASYIRAFTEPYQEFMKLTAEGRPGPAATQGTGQSIGAEQFSIQTKKDESVLSDATRMNVPLQIINSSAEQLGSYRYNAPLQQDVYINRNEPGILDAFHNNPYTQKLNSF